MIRTNNAPLACPSVGTEDRGERVAAPLSTSDAEFHKWAGRLFSEYLELYKKDEVLLECWHREAQKREKARD